jgi:hypothetical protein
MKGRGLKTMKILIIIPLLADFAVLCLYYKQ